MHELTFKKHVTCKVLLYGGGNDLFLLHAISKSYSRNSPGADNAEQLQRSESIIRPRVRAHGVCAEMLHCSVNTHNTDTAKQTGSYFSRQANIKQL